jgi:hypothetical protein
MSLAFGTGLQHRQHTMQKRGLDIFDLPHHQGYMLAAMADAEGDLRLAGVGGLFICT